MKRAIVAMAAGGMAVLPCAAKAEIAQKGNVRVSYSGGISPRELPRRGVAPIAVKLKAEIKTEDGTVPPKLRQLSFQINRGGKFQAKGLPTCPLARLKSLTTEAAKRACAKALVGDGTLTSLISFPAQEPFPSEGDLLAFNGRYKGRQAIFAQVAAATPFPSSQVIVFVFKREKEGRFATTLTANIPSVASEYGVISAFELKLQRTYAYKGKQMSYASAGCPAPDGFPGALFTLAKMSYAFEGGVEVAGTLQRECRVG